MATHQQNISNLENAVLGSEVRQSMIELFNEDYALVKKAVGIGTDITSPTSSISGYYDGNLYINNSTMDIWQMDGVGWNKVGNLKTISSITVNSSTADDGNNEVIVNFSDGTSQNFNVKNGSKGSTGYGITGAVDDGNGEFHLTISNGTSTGKIKTVKGEKGDTGATGPAGPSGKDVTSILMSGTGKQHPIVATYSDGTTQTVGIVNDGADGAGGGDMYKATYDVNDVGYVDKAAALTDGTNIVPCSSVAVKSNSLAGYGIADAYTKTEVDGMLGDKDWSTGVINKPFETLGSEFTKDSSDNLVLSNTVENKLNAALTSDLYSSTTTYSKNECCIYNNTIYKSKVNNNTNNAVTNTTYWQSTTLKSELYNKVGFVDTSIQNTLFSDGTSGFQSGDRTISFTATENCMVCGRLDLNKPSAATIMYYEIKIDGKSITYGYMNSSISGLFRYPISYNLQKGQKIDFVISASTGTSYAALFWYSLK